MKTIKHLIICAILINLFYGLKHRPRAWYSRLNSQLKHLDFIAWKVDTSLLICSKENRVIFVLIHVVHFTVANSSQSVTNALLHDLNLEFSFEDLGDLHFFLDIEVKMIQDGIVWN